MSEFVTISREELTKLSQAALIAEKYIGGNRGGETPPLTKKQKGERLARMVVGGYKPTKEELEDLK